MTKFISDHIGEHFNAVISSVTSFGMFIQLPNTAEGLIHIPNLTDDFYSFDEKILALTGRGIHRRFKIGIPLKVILTNANVEQHQLDFEVYDPNAPKKKHNDRGIRCPRCRDDWLGRGSRNRDGNRSGHKSRSSRDNRGRRRYKQERRHMRNEANNVLTQNKKASHDYFIKEAIEAGIALTGTEIKSVRARRIQLRDGYVQVYNGNAYLENVHTSEYKQGNIYNYDPLRRRQLFLRKREIRKLAEIRAQQGMTIIPLKVYLKKGFAKILLGVGQGKKQYDKREAIKKRDQEHELWRKYRV